jgi:uncharacterized delta-60 repeat protein
VFSDSTGAHSYEIVLGSHTWEQALGAAATQTYDGATGYLAVVTSAAEQQLIQDFLTAHPFDVSGAWLGGADSEVEGQWKWMAGPESGQQFWTGNANGSATNGSYANWDLTAAPPQPNTDGGAESEDYLWMTVNANWNNLSKFGWADAPISERTAYIVEYNTPATTVDHAPVITSGAATDVAENTTNAVYTATASDAEGSTLTYALSGTDATRFTIDANTGAVAFADAPDFETPLDDGGDNVYNISVTASDGVNTSAAQAVAISVSDVLASVSVTVAPAQVLEGDQTDLAYTFTRNGDTSGALMVNLGVGGTATAVDYTPTLPLSGSGLPTVQWTRLIGGVGEDYARSVATDAEGSVYVAGFSYGGSIDGQTSNGDVDGFVTKYTANGTKVWTRLVGGAGEDCGLVATAADGSVYVGGSTYSSTIDGLTSNGSLDGFVTKYTSDGTKVWTRMAGGVGLDVGRSVATGADGSVYVAGESYGSYIDGQTSNGGWDGFVIKYTPDGAIGWTRLAGGAGDDRGQSVATGPDGSVYVAGYSYGDYIDGQPSNGGVDGFVTKYTAAGTKVWTRLAGGAGDDFGQSVATSSDGSVYFAGYSYGDSIDGQAINGGADGFVTKYTADGIKAWTRLAGGAGYDQGQSVATGADGSVYIAGYTYSNSIDGQASNGDADGFVTKYTADGAKVWTRLAGGVSGDYGHSVATGADGSVYVAGQTFGPIEGQVSNGGFYDAFVTKFSSQPDQTQITFAPGSSTATLVITPVADNFVEGNETVTVSVLSGTGYTVGSSGAATATIIDDTPTYTLSTSATNVNEGSAITFDLVTTHVAPGTVLNYTLSGTGTGITSADIGGAALSGSVTVDANGLAGFTVELAADHQTEGTETLIATVMGQSASVQVNDTSVSPTAGMAYHWKSHMLLQDVTISLAGTGQPAEGTNAPLQFKNLTWDAAGHASVEVWSHSAVAFESAGFALEMAGASAITFSSNTNGWTMLSNASGTSLTVGGFATASTNAVTAGDFKLGSVSFNTAAGAQGVDLRLLSGEVGDTTASAYSVASARTATDANGAYSITDLQPGSYTLTASHSAADTGSALTASDALAALKLSVGLNPNADPDGADPRTAPIVSPYQFMAADVVGTDGHITATDAYAILQMVIKLPAAPAKEWMFVEESRDFWNETTQAFTLDRNHTTWDHSISATAAEQTNLVGVLKGDVNGSWSAPAGSTDLDVLDAGYFDALTQVYGMPLAQFGVG